MSEQKIFDAKEIFKNLNPEQAEAVKCLDGPLLIMAGAGSGKTRVLTYRIANLIAHGISPWNILAITFTNKAANEMKHRAEKLIGAAAQSVVSHQGIERDTILYPVFDLERCNGCGRCYVSCMDGGHQAISFDTETQRPKLNAKHCVGCHLCKIVCPTQAIGVAKQAVHKR